MATVVDKARPNDPVDPKLSTFNRTNAGEPNGTLTPLFLGEMVLDTTNNILWKSLALTNTSWVALTGPSV